MPSDTDKSAVRINATLNDDALDIAMDFPQGSSVVARLMLDGNVDLDLMRARFAMYVDVAMARVYQAIIVNEESGADAG